MNLYFYLDAQNQQHGPVSVTRFAECGVSASTLIWCQGMDNWTPASAVPEVREWLEQHQAEQPLHEASAEAASSHAPHDAASAGSAQENPRAPSPGAFGHPYNPTYIPCPPTHLVWAILSTLCCCLPLGIVAIVKSCQVSSHYAHGRYDEALIASDDARQWSLYALLAGLLIPLIKIVWGLFVGTSVGLWGLLTDWGMWF